MREKWHLLTVHVTFIHHSGMLNLDRLRLLQQLSVLGTISAVADAVHLTRPAVSKQLSLLQDELQTTLIERSGRGVQLTPAGQRLASRSAELFQVVEQIEAELATAKLEVSGDLRLASFGSLASSVIPMAVSRLLEEHPRLNVLITEMEPLDGLRAAASKQVDLAIVDDTVGAEAVANTLEFLPLYIDNSEAVVSAKHRLARRRRIQLAELAHERWALSQTAASFPYRSLVMKACAAAGFTPNVTSSSTLAAALEMIRTAGVVAVLPRLALRQVEKDRDFAIIPVDPPIQRRILVAVPKGAGRRPAVVAVLQALADAAAMFKHKQP